MDNMNHEEMGHIERVDHHETMMKSFRRKTLVSLVFTIPIVLLSPAVQQRFGITLPDFGFNTVLLLVFSSIVVVYGAAPFFQGAIRSLKRGILDMNVLVSLAVGSGYLYSLASTFIFSATDFYREISTLVLFLLFGHRMEMRAVLGASGALNQLVALIPPKANLVKGNDIIQIATAELRIGDVVLIRPGEKIPVDGKVIEGETKINESMITGESLSVSKKNGDEVIGGTINESGSIIIKVEKIGKNTALAQIIALVKTAQDSKPKTQQLADKAAHYLTLIAIIIGVFAFVYRYFFSAQGFVFALTLMITVFVITCPHALGLAIPTVTTISTTLAAKNGILVKDMKAMEISQHLDYVIFDKTGTLTKGQFGVSDIVSFSDRDQEKILKIAAALEIYSEHDIARGIVSKANEKKYELPKTEKFQSVAGKGIRGIVGGEEVYIGNESLLESLHIDVLQIQKQSKKLSSQGKTVVYVATNKEVKGIIALSDIIRDESFEAVNSLKHLGIKVAMLTGDNEATAQYVADALGLDDYFARILPADKSNRVKQLQQQGYKVAMVGDGVNDAPALAQSDIGIAIGAGTDVAVQSAEVVLIKDDPRDITKLIRLSKATIRKMRQNLVRATGYNTIAIPVAAGLFHGYDVILQPEYAALIMAASSIIVVINAFMLKRSRIRD